MSGNISPAVQPFGVRQLAIVAACTVVLAFLFSSRFLSTNFGAWDMRDVVAGLKMQLPFWSVPIGWLTVWAMRVHSPDSVLVGATPSRDRASIVTRQLGGLSAAVFAGALVGTAPAVVKAFATQHWSIADVISYGAVLVALASLVPVAACAAVAMRSGVALVTAPLLVVAVTMVPAFVINDLLLVNQRASIMSVSYVWSLALPDRGLMLVWQVELLRILFFGLVWMVTAKVTAGLAEWRAAGQTRALRSLLWLAVPLVVTVVVGYLQPILVEDDPNDQIRCTTHSNMRVCVFQIDDPYRDFIASAFQPLATLTQPGEGKPFTITQTARWVDNQSDGSAEVHINRIGYTRADWLDVELSSAAMRLAGSAAECRDDKSMGMQYAVAFQVLERASRIAPDEEIATAYANRLNQDQGADSATQSRLADLTDQEFTDWFEQERVAISECALSGEELP